MWKSISCTKKQINLDIVLKCGQSFRWEKNTNKDVWVGVLSHKLFLIKQDNSNIHYQVKGKSQRSSGKKSQPDEDEKFLREYFQLKVDLTNLYKHWSSVDLNTNVYNSNFDGIRVLNQDPVENLFSFICSQCNNIKRITHMVETLCKTYGEFIVDFEGKKYYSFPTIDNLAGEYVEKELRTLGFGYRAKFINQTAKAIQEKSNGTEWLSDLRETSYEEAFKALCTLPGVGAKVADCVCLMSLDKPQAVPIDTHIWQIAVNNYLPHLKKNKTLTDKSYMEIGNHFRTLYGEYAGWAQSVLFSSDLNQFKDLKEVSDGAQKVGGKKRGNVANIKKEVKSKKRKQNNAVLK